MARQTINIGTTANDGTGDPLRTAFDKINDNFAELYGGDDDASTILEHDTAPKLAANLDVNDFQITTDKTNGNVNIQPNGTGNVSISAIQIKGTSISSSDSTIINVNDGLVVDGTATVSGALSSATSLALATGATVTGIADEDDFSSNSATLLATQQSIKAYVDTQLTAQDLDFSADDSTQLSIDLDSEVLHFAGGTGISTSVSNNTVTHAIDTGTVVTLTDSQTLTNKILTSPTINAASITGTVTIDNITINDSEIATSSNAILSLNPGGSGTISLHASTEVTGTLTTDDITTDGNQTITGNLTAGGTLTVQGSIVADTFTTNSNGDITLDPAGTGTIVLTGNVTHAGTQTTTGELNVDNINVNGNTISSTNSNGGINITPNGTGLITLGGN